MADNKAQVEALAELLDKAGLDASDLLTAITTLASAKKTAQQKLEKTGTKKNILDKELVYSDEKAIIYRRGDVKSNVYYFRVYDPSSRKQYVKSLDTTDRVKALASARTLYQEILGKIERQERLTSINTEELIAKHIKRLESPLVGLTKDTIRLRKYFLKRWQKYIIECKHGKTTIDRIPKILGRDFGVWFYNQPKEAGNSNQPRSIEQVNNCISEVKAMYMNTALRDRLISLEQIPELDRLKESKDQSYKRDILSEQQYEKLWKYLEYTYMKGKKIDADGNKVKDPLAHRDPNELLKRTIFTKAMGFFYNTGLRPNEGLLLKWGDITEHTSGSDEERKANYVITVRPENAKTGKRRVIVVPVRKRLDIIRECYKKLGVSAGKDDYILMNPNTKKPYSRQTYYLRLKRVLKHSGLEAELAEEGKVLSLYSSRHFFITMRLRYGKVPLYLLSKVVGSSIKNLTDVYGHIDTELEATVVTKGMGRLTQYGFDVDRDVVSTDL